ncbi:Receptor-like protein kinase [Thalictrum thalictroides]|uniref:non-specific serine/threonine protein kinase n=1 Tax=Thalictrum thalictroides TaxID=46969 RepID=A0A7J6WU84_THATH|nr:Receptor-like protein kinase [Thalictrum thalictroides]
MFLHLLFFFFLFLSPLPTLSLNQEGLFLLQVKDKLDDPDSVLSNWKESDLIPCNWNGIHCNSVSNSVDSVDLSNSNLAGSFPIDICSLHNLTYLSLYNNSINSSLPLEISKCQNLKQLILAQNLLEGSIPETISNLPNLILLDLNGNDLSGDIPLSLSRFKNLEAISLTSNSFNGEVPSLFGNITSLKQLNLSYNPFSPSQIPFQFSDLVNLENLWLAGCNLVGEIPSSIGKLKKLQNLDLSYNRLHGAIPSSLTELTSIIQIELFNNSLSGELPLGMGKLTGLRRIDLSMNQLSGKIPPELCELPLGSLNLYQNQFEGPIPASLAKSPNLYELRMFNNRFTGELPSDLGKFSPLTWVDFSENELVGPIPASLCEKGVLEELLLITNGFSGKIPESLGQCKSLTRLRLRSNKLYGDVPVGIWGLPHLYLLDLMWNSFSGEVPKSFSGASNLSMLLISGNDFTGNIPEGVGWLDTLLEISGSDNSFTGPIPESFVNLFRLGRLDLHNNMLTGELPVGIKSLKQLNELNLADNDLSGRIPAELGSLPVLNYLDLSGNMFSGNIPVELQDLKLNRFNFSNNRLSGDLPPMYAKESYRDSFLGNPGLCGDLEGLCSSKEEVKRRGNVWLLRVIFVLACVVFIVGVSWFYVKYRNYKKTKKGIDKAKWTLTSFHKLGFSEYEILDCLDEDNVIGTGASGKVYKAILSNGEAVAVKKLWSAAEKDKNGDIENGQIKDDGFEAEVETLGKVRHKNIVRLWCSCTTRDCKLLVYEYMPNGSLGDLLHSSKGGLLDWAMRYKIAMDAAEGLSYLHHDCVPAIVHRDVKSNNILLDGDFGARVADFGVATVMDVVGQGPKSMSVIAGSCGYIAPEYAYTLRVNEKSDIYSFGVVILELVTGKRPNDPEFGETDLVNWVCTTLDKKGADHVIDPKLDSAFKEEINRVLSIGLLCTSPLPINRPSMRRVVKMLQELDAENKAKIVKKDGILSPYYYEDASDHGSVA